MKEWISLAVIWALSFSCLGQPGQVTFRGGEDSLAKKVFLALGKQGNVVTDSSKQFYVLLCINSRGQVTKTEIKSNKDSTGFGYLRKALRSLEGNWINHTNTNQQVLLPIFFIYEDENGKQDTIAGFPQANNSTAPRDVINFKPILITVYPTLHK